MKYRKSGRSFSKESATFVAFFAFIASLLLHQGKVDIPSDKAITQIFAGNAHGNHVGISDGRGFKDIGDVGLEARQEDPRDRFSVDKIIDAIRFQYDQIHLGSSEQSGDFELNWSKWVALYATGIGDPEVAAHAKALIEIWESQRGGINYSDLSVLGHSIFLELGRVDPAGALLLADRLSEDSVLQAVALSGMVEGWARTDPDSAYNWFLQQDDEYFEYYPYVLFGAVKSDPEWVVDRLENSTPGELTHEDLVDCYAELIWSDSDIWESAWRRIDDLELKQEVLIRSSFAIHRSEPAKAIVQLERGSFYSAEIEAAQGRIYSNWVKSDPKQVLDWLASNNADTGIDPSWSEKLFIAWPQDSPATLKKNIDDLSHTVLGQQLAYDFESYFVQEIQSLILQ